MRTVFKDADVRQSTSKRTIAGFTKASANINPRTDIGVSHSQRGSTKADSSKFKTSPKGMWQFRLIAVLLFLFSALLTIALISYTPKDEINTQLSLSEIWGLITGNGTVYAKIGLISNWLGLAGAIFSNFLYSTTLGYVIILLPAILTLWGLDLFKSYTISERTIKLTTVYFIFGLMFSATFGTFSLFGWFPDLSRQWYGAVGEFTARLTNDLIGKIAGLSVYIAAMILTIVISFKIALKDAFRQAGVFFSPVSSKLKPVFGKVSDTVSSELDKFAYKTVEQSEKLNIENLVPFTKIGNNINSNFDGSRSQSGSSAGMEGQSDLNDDLSDTELEEPVRIIRRNLNFDLHRNPSILREGISNPFGTIYNDPTKVHTFDKHKEEVENKIKKSNEPSHFDSHKQNIVVKKSDVSVNELLEKLKKDLATKHILISEETPANEKPLVIEVKETLVETKIEGDYINPLGTSIHDEKINYSRPGLDLLQEEEVIKTVNDEELKMNAKILQEKLETFKIFIQNLSVTPGPVVTMYEFVPAPGIKISKIESYANDIAMALKARGIRVLAPIPGKGTVGIEIPNHHPSLVRLGSVIKSNKFQQSDFKLPIALGKTISGEVYMTDLTRMPHLLIAGSTGSGKSVGINSIITSLIYKLHPKDLKFVIIDPKKVELRQYAALKNHFLAISPDINEPIITSPEDSVIALKAICAEMDLRYDILAEVGQRNILEYNRKVADGKIKTEDGKVYREMPYIVLIIDELADLMLTSAKEVESPIIRLAQLARAVGIHLVVATQRPSVDVITGIIKANFPARMSYLVASKVDSRTVLDDSGAEQLLGNGDMLFLPSGSPKPIRIQNAFISTDEVERICESLERQKGYSQPYMLPSLVDTGLKAGMLSKEDRDPLFEEAARLVIRHQQGSISMLQRRLKIGFARAGKIIDELEMTGVVGPSDGSKARGVIMESESELEAVL